ncbi:LacI family transcriptional regulator [Paraburkholderia dipogonis]|uniref:LacI family transcriptional regulator n=1 Tax=Paraburkholderia dipogonis TaxID=1211383 RepID=A0A4Y8MHF3_9BURK|nr:LacI family DNA-binding transcriptional regulator [Paraburkholderia dipogonis]TFE36861.1 LacI family transcriptional regulator [Paraburkholderia dipogonis]
MDILETRRGRRTLHPQRVTMKDVAEAANVSTMTVSNVIHNRAYVTAELRKLVQEKIKHLGYVPNRAAQELAGVSRPHVGLLYPAIINPFIAAVIAGSMRAASRLKVDVSVQLAQLDDPRALRTTMSRMKEAGVDGFLLPSPIAELAATAFRKKALDVPAVALAPGIPIAGMASVRSDERQAAYDIVSMLFDLGHRRIGHVAGPDSQGGSIARLQGYSDAMRAHGLAPDPHLVIKSPSFRFQDGLAAAETLMSSEPRVTAIFAANDTLAASVVATAQRRGISVPQDLSVVGYDDAPVAEQVWPGLTTIHQDAQVMTERAMEILEKGIKAWRKDRSIRLAEDVVVPYEVVRRASCAPAPVK